MKKYPRSGLLLAGALIFAQALVAAELRMPHLKFTDQRLANGLRVIIAPDHSAPVFAISVTYNVGSRNESPGRTGFAHLFEHMMFQGSKNVGKGEHMILIENNGGAMNGTTNEDRTNYFEMLPKNQLDLALFLESDRMRSLAVNQANLNNQRNAVQEERRLGIDNRPYGKAYLEIDNLSYDNFAYKHSTIGSMADLNAATVADVTHFFRIYYAPNNAVLTLVGDLDPQEALAQVKKYFGDIPSQPAPPKINLSEPEHYGERRETIEDPLARLPMLLMAYHIPPGNTSDNYSLQVLANILSTGQSSRLYQDLVKEKQLATSVHVQADARIGPSLFYVMAMPRPGVKPQELEEAIEEELARVQKDGVTGREMEKARAQFRRRQIQSRQTDLYTAMLLGQYAVYYNDPNLINTIFDKYNAVTAAEVKEAANRYLIPRKRAVVIDLPAHQPAQTAAGHEGRER
ncbi:MAG TPA: pitrilysin family protein [Terriglobia bacterium]|nr:pitrilysin family protein [Terriglobia bacterium]